MGEQRSQRMLKNMGSFNLPFFETIKSKELPKRRQANQIKLSKIFIDVNDRQPINHSVDKIPRHNHFYQHPKISQINQLTPIKSRQMMPFASLQKKIKIPNPSNPISLAQSKLSLKKYRSNQLQGQSHELNEQPEKSANHFRIQKSTTSYKKALLSRCENNLINLSKQIVGYGSGNSLGILSKKPNHQILLCPYFVKSMNPTKNISLFGIFQCQDNIQKAQFIKQNLHRVLANDSHIYSNFVKAFNQSMDFIELSLEKKFLQDNSELHYIFCAIIGYKIYLVRKGKMSCSFSQDYGKQIRSLTTHNNPVKSTMNSIDIREIDFTEKIDLLILGTDQRVYLQTQTVTKDVWRTLLDNSNSIGVAVDTFNEKFGRFLTQVCQQKNGNAHKNLEMVIVGLAFSNIKYCFQDQVNDKSPNTHKYRLPYVDKEVTPL